MLGEEKEDHLLGDIDYVYKDEAVQEHGKLVLGKQEVLEASRELWGKKRVPLAQPCCSAARQVWVSVLLLSLPECDLEQVIFLT